MGNSAGVLASELAHSALTLPIGSLEQMALDGYFIKHAREYSQAVETYVAHSRLAELEVIVPAGRTKNVHPLHLAAKYGKIDCVELFHSAGFNPLLADREGKTALHYSAFNRSQESALCATYLAMTSPSALAIRDLDGNNPIHLAV